MWDAPAGVLRWVDMLNGDILTLTVDLFDYNTAAGIPSARSPARGGAR